MYLISKSSYKIVQTVQFKWISTKSSEMNELKMFFWISKKPVWMIRFAVQLHLTPRTHPLIIIQFQIDQVPTSDFIELYTHESVTLKQRIKVLTQQYEEISKEVIHFMWYLSLRLTKHRDNHILILGQPFEGTKFAIWNNNDEMVGAGKKSSKIEWNVSTMFERCFCDTN